MSNVFVGRQPIYDRDMKVFAYEILYRSGQVGKANFVDGDVATSQVLINAFLEIGLERLTDNMPAFFNLTRDFIVKHDLPLPKDKVFLEVLENIDIDDEVVNAVKGLVDKGFRVALDDFVFEPKWEPLLRMADIIKVEVPAVDPAKARALVKQLRPYKAKLLAEKVETHDEFQLYRDLGFHLFQGYFFCKPNTIQSKTLNSNQMAVLRLMAELQSPNADVGALEKIIRNDPALSVKLLKYLNSPAFGLRRQVDSIRQAVTLLGLRTLRTWVTLLMMTGIKGKPDELPRTALQRARKCEVVAKALQRPEEDRYFMAGLLSTLDALMDATLETLLSELPLTQDVSDALLKQTGPMGEVLKAVIESERGEWENALALARNKFPINDLLLEATFWADDQMREIVK